MWEKLKEFLTRPDMLPSEAACRTCKTWHRIWISHSFGTGIATLVMFLVFFATGGRFLFTRSDVAVVLLMIALTASFIFNLVVLCFQHLHSTCWQAKTQ